MKIYINMYVSVACGQGMQVMLCMTKFLGIADKLLGDEV